MLGVVENVKATDEELEKVQMKYLLGMPQEQAVQILDSQGLKYKIESGASEEYNEGEVYEQEFKEGEIISGANREDICCPMYNSGMFEAMAEEGGTVAFVCGHDHINDSHALHRGIRLVYNRMSGLSSYNVISKGISDRLIQGCTVYNVYEDGQVEYGDIYYEDRYPHYREEILKVIKK